MPNVRHNLLSQSNINIIGALLMDMMARTWKKATRGKEEFNKSSIVGIFNTISCDWDEYVEEQLACHGNTISCCETSQWLSTLSVSFNVYMAVEGPLVVGRYRTIVC
jgi:hypothetical protein